MVEVNGSAVACIFIMCQSKIALIDAFSTITTGLEEVCLVVDIGKNESICSIVILKVHCWVPGIELVDAVSQKNRLWGFCKEIRGNGTFSKGADVLIEIQRGTAE